MISALEEKLSRRDSAEWQPHTKRGHKLAVLLKKGRLERRPVLDDKGIAMELMERRGPLH